MPKYVFNLKKFRFEPQAEVPPVIPPVVPKAGMKLWHKILLTIIIIWLVGASFVIGMTLTPVSTTPQSVEEKPTYTQPTYTPPEQQQPTWIPPKPSLGLDMDEVRRVAEKLKQLEQQRELDRLNQQQEQELERLQAQQRQQELEIQKAQERQEEVAAYLRLAAEYDAQANDAEEMAQAAMAKIDWILSWTLPPGDEGRGIKENRISEAQREAESWHLLAEDYRQQANYYRQLAYELSLQ